MRSDCFYVGALGSRRNHAKRTERLRAAGFSAEEIARIHSPIGINIGAQSPQEIAISIMAELVLALRGPKVYRAADGAAHLIEPRGRARAVPTDCNPEGRPTPCSKPTSTTDCARPSAATPAACRACGPTICWPASSRRWWRARASRPRPSTTSRSAAPRQAGEDSRNVARHALLLAGLPVETPGAVHNRLCGSGLNALVGAAHAITCGEADVCIAGGVESMTRAPFVVGKAEQPFAKDFKVFDSSLGARFPNPQDREPVRRRHHAADGRQPRARLSAHARGSATCSRSARSRSTPRPARTASSRARSSPCRSRRPKGKPDVVGGRGRASASRDHDGQPAEAQAPVRRRRHHGRQRVGHQRRRRPR